jgi:hypothetical protein
MKRKRRVTSASNWRYRVIKKYKHRAQKFMLEAASQEEQNAWKKVVDWFDSILRLDRFVKESGSLGLVQVEIGEVQP